MSNYSDYIINKTGKCGTKKSSGIACCRFNKNSELEILLIKKRYTYNFAAFVYGQYSKKDEKRLKYLFNGMTQQEKIDILSLRFDILWYKMWLCFPESEDSFSFNLSTVDNIEKILENIKKPKCYSVVNSKYIPTSRVEFYKKKKKKFNTLISEENGDYLIRLIQDTSNIDISWEIPKGRINKNESDLECAIREFKEETGTGLESYILIHNIEPILESYISSNVNYIHKYFISYSHTDILPITKFNYNYDVSEVGCIKWMSLGEIKFIDDSGKLYELVDRIFKSFRLKYKYKKKE
jgi:8-oxo-dGTP pyrophosphatase MutT (NUDIX family)